MKKQTEKKTATDEKTKAISHFSCLVLINSLSLSFKCVTEPNSDATVLCNQSISMREDFIVYLENKITLPDTLLL